MRRFAGPAALLAALAAAAALVGAPAATAGKRNPPRQLLSSGKVNLPIPDATAAGAGLLRTGVSAPDSLKGLPIGDVDVSLRVSHPDVSELRALLSAPDGTTVILVSGSTSGQSWGSGRRGCGGKFLTFDDESPLTLTPVGPPFAGELGPPYAGRAQPVDTYPLAAMNGGKVRGRWTLRLFDGVQGQTGTLNCWRVAVKPHRRNL